MHLEQEKYDKNICFLLTLLLMLPLFTNFMGSIVMQITGETTSSTYAIYGIVLGFFLLKFRLTGKQMYYFLMLTSIIAGLVIVNRIIFPRSQLYVRHNEEYLYIAYLFYYPVAFTMKSVKNWSHFFKYMKFSAMATPFLCIIALNVFSMGDMIDYMQVSNILLPGFLAGWYIARIQKKKIFYIPSIVSMYLQIFHGGRMSFASGLIFIALIELMELRKDKSRKSIIKTIILVISGILVWFYFDQIMEWFVSTLESFGFSDSRTIQSIIDGSAFQSKGRDLLYDRAQNELSNLGLNMYGLFGDRVLFEKYGGILYIHNIFYEFIFSFGWILGGGFCVWLVYKIIKAIFFQKNFEKTYIVSYFVCLIFLRLLVSGSFILEGQFLLLISVLIGSPEKSDEELRLEGHEVEKAE